MKKTPYLITITLITVICIIAGTCYHVGGFGIRLLDNMNINNSRNSGSSSKNITLEEFTKIEISASVLEVNIEAGEDYTLSYNCNNDYIPTYKVVDGTLTVNQTGSSSFVSGINVSNNEMTITVPETQLDDINVSTSVGDINISNIRGGSLSAESSVGNLEAEHSEFKAVNVTNDVGDIDFERCIFNGNITLSTDVGDIQLDSRGDLFDYGLNIETSVGDSRVNNDKFSGLMTKESSNNLDIYVRSNCGDIEIEY